MDGRDVDRVCVDVVGCVADDTLNELPPEMNAQQISEVLTSAPVVVSVLYLILNWCSLSPLMLLIVVAHFAE